MLHGNKRSNFGGDGMSDKIPIKKMCDGITYHKKTSDEMVWILQTLRVNQTRVRFHWGDTETGKDWGDVNYVTGTIGNSMGPVKIPILIYSRRSTGGGGLLTHCIVKITATQGGRVIYQHPKYHEGK
jgi:hypothetical protein